MMNLEHIRMMARERGLARANRLGKIELVRAIQLDEGNFDCFGKAHDGYCDQSSCLWREDCLRRSATPDPPSMQS